MGCGTHPGELLKLDIKVAKRTIQKYLPKDRHPSGQTWATFLQVHAEAIFVCDFTVVHDLCFRPIYLLVVMHLATRQIRHFNLTRNPTDVWMAQQMREISAWGEGPRFLICDNDAVFGDTFEETAMRMGTEVVHTPFYTPQANGHCERLVVSVKGASIVENVGKGQPLFVAPFLNGLHHSYSWTAPQN